MCRLDSGAHPTRDWDPRWPPSVAWVLVLLLASSWGCGKRRAPAPSSAPVGALPRPSAHDGGKATAVPSVDVALGTRLDGRADSADASAFVLEERRAMAEWRQQEPTGTTYQSSLRELGERPPASIRALARAFLRARPFDCFAEQEEEECGSMITVKVMGSLSPDAVEGDGCLNRALALWALAPGRLEEHDVADLSTEIAQIIRLPEPERELPKQALRLLRGRSDPVRVAVLVELPEAIAAANLEGLSSESLRALYDQAGLEAALLALDPGKEWRFLLAAVDAEDATLSDETLDALTHQLADRKEAEVERTLRRIAKQGPCAASMTAALALALAERGNPAFLPKPRRTNQDETEAEARRALCRIAHDTDPDRQTARYKEFLPPRGVVVVEHTGEWFAPESEARTTFTRKQVTEWNLPSETFAPSCTEGNCETAPTVTVYFARGKNGVLYVDHVDIRHPYLTC